MANFENTMENLTENRGLSFESVRVRGGQAVCTLLSWNGGAVRYQPGANEQGPETAPVEYQVGGTDGQVCELSAQVLGRVVYAYDA